MCLILFAYQQHSHTPLIMAANRDEFFARPSAPAAFWPDNNLLAGRDLEAGGTWLGVTRTGRFAAVTNVREPGVEVDNALSRGELTTHFLQGTMSPRAYLESIGPQQMRYRGFNLLVGTFSVQESQHATEMLYLSNRQGQIQTLEPGIYGLSNHLLDTPWPKVAAGKQWLQTLSEQQMIDHAPLRSELENSATAADEALPSTGVSYEWEKMLSAAFITSKDYGTRATTVLSVNQGKVTFSEQNYQPSQNNQPTTEGTCQAFEFSLQETSNQSLANV